jgi:hypothetical protein
MRASLRGCDRPGRGGVFFGEACEHAFERGLVGLFAQALDGVACYHAALTQNKHASADLLHRVEHVRAVEDDLATRSEGMKQFAHRDHGVGVEAGKWLVQDQHFGVVQQRRGEEDLLSHALRVGGHRRVAIVVERKEVQKHVDLAVKEVTLHAAQASGEPQILAPGKERIEVRLFWDVAEALLEGRHVVDD